MARRRRLGRGDLRPLSLPVKSPKVLGWYWSETPCPGPLLADAGGRNTQVEAPEFRWSLKARTRVSAAGPRALFVPCSPRASLKP